MAANHTFKNSYLHRVILGTPIANLFNKRNYGGNSAVVSKEYGP